MTRVLTLRPWEAAEARDRRGNAGGDNGRSYAYRPRTPPACVVAGVRLPVSELWVLAKRRARL